MILPGLLGKVQQLDHSIIEVRTKIVPKPLAAPREKPPAPGANGARHCWMIPHEQLQHYPELAEALQRLVSRHRK